MMSLRRLMILGVCLFFAGAAAALAGSVSAKKDGVKVTAEASKGSTVIQTLNKGDVLETSERVGMYWMVKTSSGKSGFVSVLKVKRAASKGGGISNVIRQVSQEGRENGEDVENARARSAVMGVRGLDESSETQYAGNTKPNLRLVYKMEDRMVSNKSLSRLERQVMRELELLAKKNGN